MNCPRKDIDLLVRRAAGRLTAAEQAALDQHLTECADCRSAAEAQLTVWNALEEWSAAPVSEDFDRRLYARMAAAEAESPWTRVWRAVTAGFSWKVAFSLAGACAVLLALLLLRGPLVSSGPMPPAVSAQKTIDIDQVESALDDVDMLNQLGGAVPAQPQGKADSGS